MSYVGAAAEPLRGVADSLGRLGDEASVRRARIAALLQEAGETTSTVATLAQLEEWAHTSAADARQAALIAAADASACPPSAPAQTGLRASMGLVDDVAFELLFVNDVSRLVFGRDINTGTAVGPGGRAMSALGLIPFGKLAKLGKLASVGADAAAVVSKADAGLGNVVWVANDAGHAAATGARRVEPGRAASEVDRAIMETITARGHVTSRHVLDPDEALDAGITFLGDGYRELGRAGSGVYRSADGLRQFRIDERSLLGMHGPHVPHVHLETFASPGGLRLSNNHIPLKELQ